MSVKTSTWAKGRSIAAVCHDSDGAVRLSEIRAAASVPELRDPEEDAVSPRARLPQTDGVLHLTDGGIETVLIHQQGIDLPAFAAFPLVDDEHGRAALRAYFAPYLALAAE